MLHFNHYLAYLPTYLNQMWHSVFYIGLISVYVTLTYKIVVSFLHLC
jgi:hypothetical protein